MQLVVKHLVGLGAVVLILEMGRSKGSIEQPRKSRGRLSPGFGDLPTVCREEDVGTWRHGAGDGNGERRKDLMASGLDLGVAPQV